VFQQIRVLICFELSLQRGLQTILLSCDGDASVGAPGTARERAIIEQIEAKQRLFVTY